MIADAGLSDVTGLTRSLDLASTAVIPSLALP
jgi:hypothetical protein